MNIVGIDCAAQPENTGLAWTRAQGDHIVVREPLCASKKASAASIIARWMGNSDRALLALDAPLGWPTALGYELALHRAGESLTSSAHTMFRRLTDDQIYERLRKRPLEVAADRIARAAHSALRLLAELRQLLGHPLPLLWSPDWNDRVGVIEVYPAGTRLSLGIPVGGGSLAGLEPRITFETGVPPDSEHARDAIVCAIAAVEFLNGRAISPSPDQNSKAVHEGWIWVGDAPKTAYEAAAPQSGDALQHVQSVPQSELDAVCQALTSPDRLWTPLELLDKPSSVPKEAGLYGWYFRDLPAVPGGGPTLDGGFKLLYVGIAPHSAKSRSTLRKRIAKHLKADASQSNAEIESWMPSYRNAWNLPETSRKANPFRRRRTRAVSLDARACSGELDPPFSPLGNRSCGH